MTEIVLQEVVVGMLVFSTGLIVKSPHYFAPVFLTTRIGVAQSE